MKKVFVIIFMITSAVSFNQVAKAEDGSLKIDAETKKNNKTEDYYFEQETELSKLFNDAVTKNISQIKEEESVSYNKDKALIFDTEMKKESVADNYTKHLFLLNESKLDREKSKIALKSKEEAVNWNMILLLIAGFIIMMVSVYRGVFRKRGQ